MSRQAQRVVLLSMLLLPGCFLRATDPPRPDRVILSPLSVILVEQESRQLDAVVVDQHGDTIRVPLFWSSTDDSVASVGSGGMVTAAGCGEALVRVSVAPEPDTARGTRGSTCTGSPRRTGFDGPAGESLEATTLVRVVPPFRIELRAVEVAQLDDRSCRYRLEAIASGGRPADVATWADSDMEVVPEQGSRTVVALSVVDLVDRFNTQVLQPGDSVRTEALVAEYSSPGFRLIYRLRYSIGDDLRYVTEEIPCLSDTARGTP